MAQRWRCKKCKREWVLALGWDESHGCIYPQCREPHPELVTFTPQFRGGDIERHELPTQDPAVLFAPDTPSGPGQLIASEIPAALAALGGLAAMGVPMADRLEELRGVYQACSMHGEMVTQPVCVDSDFDTVFD